MKPIAALSVLAALLAGCAAPATAPAQAPMRTLSLTGDLEEADRGCGTVNGTGDSHPGDGRFYELTVSAERLTAASKGTVVLYTMPDVLAGADATVGPSTYQGAVTSLSIKNGRAHMKGTLTTGKAFTLRIDDNVTDAITSEGPYDYFWFETEGLKVEKAFIHEGDYVVTTVACPATGL